MAKQRITDKQKKFFDSRFFSVDSRASFRRRVVGFVAEHFVEAETVQQLMAQARQTYPGRMVYFEPIGFTLY